MAWTLHARSELVNKFRFSQSLLILNIVISILYIFVDQQILFKQRLNTIH